MEVSEVRAEDGAASISVVIAAARETCIERTLQHLRAQTVRGGLEVIVVAEQGAKRAAAALDEMAGAGFARTEIVWLPELDSRAAAHAAGAAHARTAVVAFVEDHCFPQPGWAEALLRRHAQGFAAVGPLIENANPDCALSWCDQLIHYGPWSAPSSAGVREALPGHNCSYAREELLYYEEHLEGWLEIESELHLDLVRRGRRLFLDAEAIVRHVNVSRWSSWMPSLFHAGRLYAAARCRSWAVARRLGYALAWPMIAVVRWVRIFAAWPTQVPGLPARTRLGPALGVGLIADALGQAVGYLAGAGDAAERMRRFDFDRAAQVRPGERLLWTAAE